MSRDLTAQQRRFARAVADGIPGRYAIAAAGYSLGSPSAIHVAAHRLNKHHGVQAEIKRLRGQRSLDYLFAAPLGLKVVLEHLGKEHPPEVRLEAAIALLKAAGLLPLPVAAEA
jgi:phage terminase small subunit